MICPRCSSKAKLILTLASEQRLHSREPKVFVQYRCAQGHYFITLKVFDETIYKEHYLISNEQNSDSRNSIN